MPPTTCDDITVCIPTIPTRSKFFARALASVTAQIHQAAGVSVATDTKHEGAPVTRNRALQAIRTPWTAFLDDDDEFLPEHLDALLDAAKDTHADYIYSWFHCVGGKDPFGHFGKPFDYANPLQTTITVLVRTDLARLAGFHTPEPKQIGGLRHGEDYDFTLRCMELGAKIHHHPQKTWIWNHHGANTSGLPSRW